MSSEDQKLRAEIKDVYALLQNGDEQSALENFHRLIAVEKIEDNESLTLLADLAKKLGEKIVAINIYYEIVERLPESVPHILELSQAYIDNGMLAQGELWANKALELAPDNYRTYVKLSYIAMQSRKYSVAIDLLERARELKPSDPVIYNNLVTSLIQTNRSEEALKYAEKLIKLNAKNADYHHLYGRALIGMGRFDEGIKAYERAIQINSTFGNSYYDIATSKKFSLDDKDDMKFISKAEKVLDKSMPAAERACIHYALGKIHGDCKEYEKSFENYRQGNLIRKPAIASTLNKTFFDKTFKLFDRKFFEANSSVANDSTMPVFIVGMPRSGSTLIEQIIASHPQGCGVGEISAINQVVANLMGDREPDEYRQALVDACANGNVSLQADSYLKLLKQECADSARVVDKQLENYLFLGLIFLMYPNAHVIHAHRSPLDTALSCYFQAFDALGWANDLELIAQYYREYREVMDKWQEVLPEGRIIDVHYEQVTADPENEAKRIIDAIGLDWHPDCLEFHRTERSVNTASIWQVRQPMYTTSQKRWLNYAKHLEGFANDIYDYLDDSDIDAFAEQGIKLKKKGWISRLLG